MKDFNKTMKIAILVQLFPPKWLGGTEIATYNIAKYLTKRGHEVHIITSWDKGLPTENIKEKFYIHCLKYPKIKFVKAALFGIKALIVLKRINPDVIHIQSIPISIIGFLAKKIFKKPYIVYSRGSDVYLPWRFKTLISKLGLKNADAVISLTENMKNELQKISNRFIFVIPNGIDLETFENLTREETRNQLQIKEDERIVLFVGTLKAVKGIKYLIEAINIAKGKIPGIRLLIVGDGEERRNLEKLIKELNLEDYVTFVGKVSNEEIPEYMAASDIFVLPSLSESFGIVNLEAMASGLPIIATKVGGVPEIIKEGENGFLVEPKNPKEIAEKVLLLLGDNELREKISNNNKEKAKEYNWERVVEKLENVYLKVLKNYK